MQQQIYPTQVLTLETTIRANKPRCQCKGGGMELITGTIKKVISNHTGNWYYLSNGYTVSEKWIVEILN